MGLPKIDLTTFFLSISSAAFMSMGDQKIDLDLAKQNIDLLELMQDKTKGNLTPDEERLIHRLLFETRMRFVEAQKENQNKK
jgi:predicted ATP-grasp superfamily ATP-dependent carboligase